MRNSFNRTLFMAFIVGIVLICTVFGVSTGYERRQGLTLIGETLDFMKTQSLRYDNQIVTSETKSQIALLDKLQELSRQLSKDDVANMDEIISEYANNQRMSGIIILDENGDYVTGAFCDDMRLLDWSSVLHDSNILDVIDYPEKNYLSHVENDDGSVYDFAAVSLDSGNGLVFGYILESENELADRESNIRNLLTGYKLEKGGIMVIARGDNILSTNSDIYPGIAFCREVARGDDGQLVTYAGKQYLAGSAYSGDYQFYTFFPISEVYRQRYAIIAYVLAFYILFVTLYMYARQRELQRVEGQRLRFLRQMSHDIRTPINGIRGMVRIANSCPDDDEKQQVCRQKIWEASDLLMDLVNDVLDMGKLESGVAVLEKKPFDMHELVENAIAVMEGAAQHKGISITLEQMQGTHWHLIGSPVQVGRILNNIIGNAIKYNKDNGSVKFSCREIIDENSKGKAVFEFVCADTGIGMDKEFQKHMFEQFTQENAVDEVAHHGTGLGLSIAKSLIDEMQGSIKCESKRNEGTTFTITIPFEIDMKAMLEAPKENEIENIPENSLNGISVLLVEDNEMNMEIAQFILEDMGMKVTKAWNGQEAVAIFSNEKPGTFDIILMDMMMPVMNGEEATRTIRGLDREDAKKIPIIAATANAFAEDIAAALAAGMNDHLAKPLDEKPLRQMITKYVVVMPT